MHAHSHGELDVVFPIAGKLFPFSCDDGCCAHDSSGIMARQVYYTHSREKLVLGMECIRRILLLLKQRCRYRLFEENYYGDSMLSLFLYGFSQRGVWRGKLNQMKEGDVAVRTREAVNWRVQLR